MRGTRSTTIAILASGLLAGSALGAAAQAEVAPPEPFTGHVVCGGQSEYGSSERQEVAVGDDSMVIVSERGTTWTPRASEMSDLRLEGNYTISFDSDAYYAPGVDGSLDVGAGTWRIVNDAGAWQGSYHIVSGAPVVVPLVGEGAYEGLTAIVESAFRDDCAWDWSGLIIDGSAPDYPEPPAE